MEKSQATEAAHLARRETFSSAAATRKTEVRKIRERNRVKRLQYLLLGIAAFLCYALKRAYVDGDPLGFGFPSISPDTMVYLIPPLLLMTLAMTPLLVLQQGKSPAIRFTPDQIGIGFDDVRGIDVVREEVVRTLQIFLAYRTFKEELGGNPRRGVLFEGTPGTGKTHIAKAMAAEAGVPFFFVSAPAFQSMFFGMTAFRIRAFFRGLKKAARKEGGAIGFIEEIDAVGMARQGMNASPVPGSSRMSTFRFGSNDNGPMVNELLIQLQSFDSPPLLGRLKNRMVDAVNAFLPSDRSIKKRESKYSNVLIIAATNRADTLDPALLRPGRFDRILHFDLPSRAGRRELIDYFLARRKHAAELDQEEMREEFASMTLGYSPAMLEHVLDEALVWALRDDRRELNWRDVQRARLTQEIGIAQPVAYTDRERDLIATHEAGHAVAAYLCAKDRRLEVLSIIKRRSALGLLAHSDAEERFTKTKSELEGTLKVALGGMAAEQLFFGESGTGPSSDLNAATTLAAQMVGSFGMGSSLVSYEAVNNGPHGSPNIVAKVLSNDDTKKEVDDILRKHKDQVAYLLETNKDLVEALRDALLEREELMGDEILAVLDEAEKRRAEMIG
ncbi:MAG TPA: AAA family ATPase [Actinomycetota bacterium]|nr:AAA family ATPase [Actinomycetota bacterium]